MTDERKEEILNNLIAWIVEHDSEFIEDAKHAMRITEEEAIELELTSDDEDDEDYEDEDDDEEDED